MKKILLSVTVLLAATFMARAEVRVWEESLTLPTYRLEPPDSYPMFYSGEAYQGAKKMIYPYPFLDHVTDIREQHVYKALYLENDYIKLCVLPEIGGRLFYALDKTNNYEIFYHQHVIKPALIGMLGAWISGGIEWCVFHHHRNTTHMPVDYTLAENPDGSKTIWFGETERRHRMKWLIGLTLYPERSNIEATVKFFNRTSMPHSILYWANVAVHVNDDYQIIFPPGIEYATFHSKNDFCHWPVANETYRGVDYRGVDLSWWKNHPEPVSFFAWDLQEDFMGGYDHGKRAGVVHVGNHHNVCGAKLWEWSPGPRGRMWDKILTDTDGPYAELMVGAFSDNQPDYSWIKPYEIKTFKQHWYPVREIGGFKNANLKAAVNLEIEEDGSVLLGFNTTSDYKNAKAVLIKNADILFEQKIEIGPARPFLKKIQVSEGTNETELYTALITQSGDTLITYRPVEKEYHPELPEVVKPPPPPEEMENPERIYLAGLRLEQIHNPNLDPVAYYQEILKRDPNDARANTRLGIHYNKRALFVQAEEHLRRAIERLSTEYIRPGDTEAYFQLGLALRHQGRVDEAYEQFYRASWDYAFLSASHYQLAELSCIKGNYIQALEHIDRSLSTNIHNTKALSLEATILRKLGQYDWSVTIAEKCLRFDPLDFWAMNEWYLSENAQGHGDEAKKVLDDFTIKIQGNVQSYLELATDYENCGLYYDAIDILQRPIQKEMTFAATYPLVYYYLGYIYQQLGDEINAGKYFTMAMNMPAEYCFPFRSESIKLLNSAIAFNPRDARAHYYLGNLLYDIQPDAAIANWELSREIDDLFALVHRNLGWGYYRHEKNIAKAAASYERALLHEGLEARLFSELDELYELANVPPEKRLAVLQKNHDIVSRRNDSFLREIMVLVMIGRYDDAIDYLTNHHFHVKEGGGQIHDVFVDGLLLRGLKFYEQEMFDRALADFKLAAEYPENLSVGRPRNDRRAPQVAYYIATAYEALGDEQQAKIFYSQSSSQKGTEQWPETRYYQGLSIAKLGDPNEANQIFDELVKTGREKLSRTAAVDFFAKFGEKQTEGAQKADAHYILALGYLGKKQNRPASNELQKAIELNTSHLWARAHLDQL